MFEVKSTNGDTMLGGEDFDEVLLKARKNLGAHAHPDIDDLVRVGPCTCGQTTQCWLSVENKIPPSKVLGKFRAQKGRQGALQ